MSASFFMPVRDVMARNPQRIHGLGSVDEALAMMKKADISALVVERRDDEDEFGLVLVGDIAREVIGKNRSLRRTHVYEIMTKPAPAVDADMNIKYAIRQMTRLGTTHCIVLHGRDLVGVVTLRQMTLRYLQEIEKVREP